MRLLARLYPEQFPYHAYWKGRRKGDLRLEEIGWTLIEPADPGWMGLTDLYFRLWRPLSPSSLSMRTPSGRVGNDHEQLSLIGFTRRLISVCTSRMEFATSKGTPSRGRKVTN
jgi:hypothetical protein